MGAYIQKFGMKNDTDPHAKQSLNYCLALRAYRNYSPDEIFVLLLHMVNQNPQSFSIIASI